MPSSDKQKLIPGGKLLTNDDSFSLSFTLGEVPEVTVASTDLVAVTNTGGTWTIGDGTNTIATGDIQTNWITTTPNPNMGGTTGTGVTWQEVTTTPAPFSVVLPDDMSEEEATKLLTTCVVCDQDAPGICPTCKEAIIEAREIMLEEWMKDFAEFQKAG